MEQAKSGIANTSKPFWCKTIGRSSEKCKVHIGPMATFETAVAITIAKMGIEPICLRCRNCNRKHQWEWLHTLQCNQSLRRRNRNRNRSVGTDLEVEGIRSLHSNGIVPGITQPVYQELHTPTPTSVILYLRVGNA